MAFDCNGSRLPDKFLHPRDRASENTGRVDRARVRVWKSDGSTSDRVYDAATGETGYEHRVTPLRQAIRWDGSKKRWVFAEANYSQKPVAVQARIVKASVGTNRHRGGNF